MRSSDCQRVQDMLPDSLHGRLSAIESAAVSAHLQNCADCRIDFQVASAVSVARIDAPAELHDRVRASLRGRVTIRNRWPAALAAGIAIVVMGGTLAQLDWNRSQPATAREVQGAGWIGVDDAFLSGAASLRDLSVEELEKLLVELDS